MEETQEEKRRTGSCGVAVKNKGAVFRKTGQISAALLRSSVTLGKFFSDP